MRFSFECTAFPVEPDRCRERAGARYAATIDVCLRTKLIVEPTAAMGVPAALRAPNEWRESRMGVLLSGGNVDLAAALKLFEGA
jgi:threonine dehydratase